MSINSSLPEIEVLGRKKIRVSIFGGYDTKLDDPQNIMNNWLEKNEDHIDVLQIKQKYCAVEEDDGSFIVYTIIYAEI